MPSLFLHAADPWWQPAETAFLADALRRIGFIGAPTASEQFNEFQAGDRFLKLVMFLGCSPQVALAPEQAEPGQPVCHVRLLSFKKVTRLVGVKQPKVRCPACRATVELSDADAFDARHRCQHCGAAARIADLDWRQSAGFGRCFIEIEGIYPQEAVPSDSLLSTLNVFSQCDWKYFYVQE